MKIAIYRFAALVLVFCLLTGLVSSLAVNVAGVGEVTTTDITWLSDRATLTRNTVKHTTAGQQTERYIEWNNGGQIRPIVVTGDTIFGGALTLDTAAEKMTAKGYDVAAGMNGDYFTVSTGVPLGLTVVNGSILVSDPGLPAVGFFYDGQAFISKPGLKTTLSYGSNKAFTIENINKPRGTNGLYLYTSDYGVDTHTNTTGTNIILQTYDKLKVGGSISAKIVDITSDAYPVKLGEGLMCLSAESAEATTRIKDLTKGMTVYISTETADPRYTNCEYIVGGYRMLVENSVVVAPKETTITRAPRTAIGIRGNGTVVYYSVDGRQSSYSAGLGLTELAERMLSLGCVVAVELDGGGSTDMTVRFPGDFELTRLGKPSDGTPRKVANHILFVNTSPKTGIVNGLYVKSGRIAALTGAEIPLSDIKVTAMDTNYHPMEAPYNLFWSSSDQQIVQVSNTLKAVAPGSATLTVTSGSLRGTFDVEVADRPDSIVILDTETNKPVTELELSPNARISLKAVGLINGVEAPGGVFYWTTSDNYATVDANGVLTAGSMSGTSTRLIVGMEDTVATINVNVGKAPAVLEDFEKAKTAFSASAVGTGYTRNSEKAQVRYGLFSGEFMYDFSVAANGTASLPFDAEITLDGSASYLSLWVKGDGSGNMLNVSMVDAQGQVVEMTAATLNFTDYRQVFVPLLSISRINGLKLVRAPGGAASGTFYVDQVLSTSSDLQNTSAPVISLSLQADGASLNITGSAIDYGSALLKKSDIKLTMDGSDIPFEFDDKTGIITAKRDMPLEGLHIITLTAKNRYGNYDRVSKEFDQPTTYTAQSFKDISTHWSGKYVELLDRRGVLPKSESTFRPGDIITRAEVAVFMSKVLKLDETAWSYLQLPYDDLADIPASAMGAVKALYGNGYMTGVATGNGRRIFSPNSGFTRAEMFGLIGRAIPKGIYKNAGAVSFSDYYSVPEYAIEYVDLLIGMGIVTGADNKLNPSGTVTRAEFATILARIS